MFARLAIAVSLICASHVHAAEITRRVDGWVSVKGVFTSQDGQRFVELAKTIPGETTVVMESTGGSAAAAVTIGTVIKDRGWATVVYAGKTCASACAFAWLAGSPRIMDRDAHIGLHGVYVMENGKPVVSGPANAIMGSYLRSIGLSPEAIYFATDAKPEGMNWVTIPTARQLGVDVFVLDKPWERKWAKPAEQKTQTRESKKGSLLKQLYLRAQQDQSAN